MAKTPSAIDDHLLEAREHHQAGRLAQAEEIYKQILQRQPDNAAVLSKLGAALAGQGRLDETLTPLQRAIELEPDLVEAHNNLGAAFQILGRLDDAVAAFRRALAIKPDHVSAHVNLGNALKRQGMLEDAVASYRRALEIDGDCADAHNGLGAAEMGQGKMADAAACFRRALELNPHHAEALNNLGNILRSEDQLEEAAAMLQRALEINPGLIEAHINLGNTLKSQGNPETAEASFKRALEIDPANAEAHWNYSQVLLLMGRYTEGWAEYEWRTKCEEFSYVQWDYGCPRWDGSNLDGKTILLSAEQGLGDTFMFFRYIPTVAALGGRVIVQCPESVKRLFENAPGVDRVVTAIDDDVRFDLHASLHSLPHIFKTDAFTIPDAVPYLRAPADGSLDLAKTEDLKVGIVWAGNPSQKNDRNRSTALGNFDSLLSMDGCAFYSLQVGDRREDIRREGLEDTLTDLGQNLNDFADTARAIQQMDLVIAVDTAVAHLAGALGHQVWTTLCFVPSWIWMLDRDDTPWYPTMRLFRQTAPGDWQGVFRDVETALAERLGS
ncbi:MAG: tetratricopeptide repeat protein [Proteobacteria bacterium]|nr:tetratricopeptide repeat protein [Pseudomonadota bacterium]